MGNEASRPQGAASGAFGPGQAEDLLRARMQDFNVNGGGSSSGAPNPAGQEADENRLIKATENAPPLDARSVAISAAAHLAYPEAFKWQWLQGTLRRGYADRLQIQFDSQNMTEFVPKLTRLLSDANLIHTLELFCDKLPKTRLLPCFSYPNVLDSLPRRMEALRSLHFATAAGQLLHFDVIAKVMMRAPNLCALKIEGAQVVLTSNNYADYIPCGLHALVLVRADLKVECLAQILCRSQRSLKRFHLEHVTNLLRDTLATYLSLYLPEMTHLTAIVPDASAVSDGVVEMQDILDLAFARPMGALQELYVSGLALSSNALLRQNNQIAVIRTPAPALQKLTMHWCNRCPMSSLTMAILQGRLPKLSWIEAIWSEADYNLDDFAALMAACEKQTIALSPKMQEYYSWCAAQHRAKLIEEQKTTKQHKDDLSKILEETAAAIPDTGKSRSQSSRRSDSRHTRQSSSKHRHHHRSSSKRSSSREKGRRNESRNARDSPRHRSKALESSSEESESEGQSESSEDSEESDSRRNKKGKSKSKSKSRSRSSRRGSF